MNTRQLLTAATKVLSGDFSAVVKSTPIEAVQVIPSEYHHPSNGGPAWFVEANGKAMFHFQYFGYNSAVAAYEKCPPVNAIINRKAEAYINGNTWILNTQGKAKGKEATNEAANKLRKLLKNPNPLQSWDEFEAQGYIYQQIFGYNIVLPIKPVGYKENIEAFALWNIPPSMVNIEETDKLFYQTKIDGMIKEIVLTYKGNRTVLKLEDIYIMKGITPSFCSLILPESRICALALPINNIIGAYESRNVLINYRGALGILTNDSGNGTYSPVSIPAPEKEQLQNDLRRYGLKNSQWQFILTSASLKWQQMGVPTKDLMLFEEIEDDIQRICDSYNYPYELLSSAKGVTYANKKEAKQLLYQDAIMPEAKSIYGQWNAFFNTEKYSIILDKDYSTIPVLQQDQVQAATARKMRNDALLIEFQNDLITLNRWLELNGEDPRPDGDVYYSEFKKKQNEDTNQEQEQPANAG